MQRLIFVYNLNSSNYIRVKREVLSHAAEIQNYMVGKFLIKKMPFEDNVKALKNFLQNGDVVIAAGGDATAAVTANAILQSGKDVTLGVLPYGNFNDLARTIGTMKFSDIFSLQGDKYQINLTKTRKLYPLNITVDDKHWRYATCYLTAGMTAEAVELFDDPKVRKSLKKGHKSSWRSYLYLVKWYFKNRHKKVFVPEYTLNGKPTPTKISDYCALSGKSMCRIMKGGDDYLKPKVFRSYNCRLTNLWRMTKLMLAAIFVRTPGFETRGDVLDFLQPATIELQAEGEYKVFRNIKKITVRKDGKCLKVITR